MFRRLHQTSRVDSKNKAASIILRTTSYSEKCTVPASLWVAQDRFDHRSSCPPVAPNMHRRVSSSGDCTRTPALCPLLSLYFITVDGLQNMHIGYLSLYCVSHMHEELQRDGVTTLPWLPPSKGYHPRQCSPLDITTASSPSWMDARFHSVKNNRRLLSLATRYGGFDVKSPYRVSRPNVSIATGRTPE